MTKIPAESSGGLTSNPGKIRTLLLGVFAAGLVLFILDPYVPGFGILALNKDDRPDSAQSTRLTELLNEPQWSRFQPFQIPPGAKVVERNRHSVGENLINSKYALMAPNSKIRDAISIRLDGHEDFISVFDVVYTTDALSRRTTVPEGPKNKSAQLALLGCSFTWGSGVADHETFSSILASKNPDVRVLNLGIRGGAPNDFIDDLTENPQRLKTEPNPKNIAVLTLIGDHIERALCKTRCYTEPVVFKADTPVGPLRLDKTRYTLKDGKLIAAGRFRDEGLFWTRLKKWLFSSRIVTKIFYDYSGYPSDDDIFLFAKMIERIRDLAIEQTGGEFAVAFFPDTEASSHSKILKIFDELHIAYFDYSQLNFKKALGNRAFFAIDNHPTALGHAAYAELLFQDLRKRTSAIKDSN